MENKYKRWKNNQISKQQLLHSIDDLNPKCKKFTILKNILYEDKDLFDILPESSLFKIWFLFHYSFQYDNNTLFLDLLERLDRMENFTEFLCIIPFMIKEFPSSELLGKLCVHCLENFYSDDCHWITQEDSDSIISLFYTIYKYSINYSDYDTRLTILIYTYQSCNYQEDLGKIIFKCFQKDEAIRDKKIYFLKNIIEGYDKFPKSVFQHLSLSEKKELFREIIHEFLDPYSFLYKKISLPKKRDILSYLHSLIPKPKNVQKDSYNKSKIQQILDTFVSQLYDPNYVSFHSFNDLYKMAYQISDQRIKQKMIKKINTIKSAIDYKRFRAPKSRKK